jgi:hypothetical protein
MPEAQVPGGPHQGVPIVLNLPSQKRRCGSKVKVKSGPAPGDRRTFGLIKRMQYRPGLLAGFLAGTGLEFGPFR